MTLKKWFKRLGEDTYVKIATKNGTRFIFAGKCKDVLQEMSKIDEKYKNDARKSMEKAKEKYLTASSIDIKSRYSKKERKAKEGHLKGLGTAYLKAIVAYEKFKPMIDRTVVDDFVAHPCMDDVDAPVYVAYIEGNEVGIYEKINSDGNGEMMQV